MNREHIASELRRAVLVEAGHRCAIPTCRTTTTEICHIVPWAAQKEHQFENLIALCPNCHTRFDKGEIDRPSMRVYKQNLNLLNNRYGEFERRLFEYLAKTGEREFAIGYGGPIMVHNAALDGLLKDLEAKSFDLVLDFDDGRTKRFSSSYVYQVTDKGVEFIKRLAEGRDIA